MNFRETIKQASYGRRAGLVTTSSAKGQATREVTAPAYWFPDSICPDAAYDSYPETQSVKLFDFPANDPTNLHVAGVAATSFRVCWQDNATNEKFYEIWVKRVGGTFLLAKTVRANGTTALIKFQSQQGPALTPNTEYIVKVRAVNRAGVPSGFSGEVTLRTHARIGRPAASRVLART